MSLVVVLVTLESARRPFVVPPELIIPADDPLSRFMLLLPETWPQASEVVPSF